MTTAAATELLSFDEFVQAERAWDDLVLSSPRATPFQTHAWLRLWWKHFGAGQRFVAPAVRRGDSLLAAAPLALRRVGPGLTVGEIVGTGPVPTRGMGLADKADLPVRDGDAAACEALCGALAGLLDRVDVLDVKGFDASSATREALERASPRSTAARCMHRSVSPYLALPATWEEYLGSRSGNFRKHLRKYWRELGKAGEVEVVRFDPGQDASPWLADVFEVNAASWKAERGTNLFRHTALRAFFAELVPALADRERIDLRMLRVDGRAVAYELCFDFAGRLFSYNSSFRRDWGRLSPGTALTAAVIEAACGRGRTEYDMLRGEEEYKTRWSTTAHSELQLVLPAPRLAARLYAAVAIHAKHRAKQWPWLVDLADRASGLVHGRRGRPSGGA